MICVVCGTRESVRNRRKCYKCGRAPESAQAIKHRPGRTTGRSGRDDVIGPLILAYRAKLEGGERIFEEGAYDG